MQDAQPLSRREFLRIVALTGGGFAVGAWLPARADRLPADIAASDVNRVKPFEPNAWVRVTPDNTVTLVVDKSEMGQGVMTALPMLLAEELAVDLDKVRLVEAPAAREYKNPKLGMQATGGSTSVGSSWERLRQAGAAARVLLIEAAAREWSVAPASLTAEHGIVFHRASGRRAAYGELATRAAALPVPAHPPLKPRADYTLIGKPLPRVDTPAKVDGSARFGIDVKVPHMLIATVAHPPAFGGSLAGYDAAKAKAVRGVHAVVKLDTGLGVVAQDYWTALKGVKAANPRWHGGPHARVSSRSIRALYERAARTRGVVADKRGAGAAAFASASRRLEATYWVPFAAHATMEPMNCTAHVRTDACEVWAPTQAQTGVQMTAAKITGLPQEKIIVHTTFLGGGFGRRFEQDFVADAVRLSKAVGRPVKVVWSREQDMTHDYYRPAVLSRVSAGLDAHGKPVAWTHRIVTASIMDRVLPQKVKHDVDPSSVEGATKLAYDIPNVEVDYVHRETGVPVGFWRSVANSHTAFVKEGFVDELAYAAGQDPFAFRKALLAHAPHELRVLTLAADKAGWGRPLPEGRARGIAVHKAFGSYVAQVAEVSLAPDGRPKVERVVCAVDCGTVVNPNIVRAQMEGAIVFGLNAAFNGPITVAHGGVQQQNFNTYPLLRLNETPVTEVHLVDSDEAPTGVGEPGVPPIAPAVANALFVLTGKRIRSLPITAQAFKA